MSEFYSEAEAREIIRQSVVDENLIERLRTHFIPLDRPVLRALLREAADALEGCEKALGEATVTPTDDEREALDYAIRVPIAARHVDHKPLWELIRAIQDSVLSAGFRRSEVPEPSAEDVSAYLRGDEAHFSKRAEPQGEPSDAQVVAALQEWWYGNHEDTWESKMRAALRAALSLREGGVR